MKRRKYVVCCLAPGCFVLLQLLFAAYVMQLTHHRSLWEDDVQLLEQPILFEVNQERREDDESDGQMGWHASADEARLGDDLEIQFGVLRHNGERQRALTNSITLPEEAQLIHPSQAPASDISSEHPLSSKERGMLAAIASEKAVIAKPTRRSQSSSSQHSNAPPLPMGRKHRASIMQGTRRSEAENDGDGMSASSTRGSTSKESRQADPSDSISQLKEWIRMNGGEQDLKKALQRIRRNATLATSFVLSQERTRGG